MLFGLLNVDGSPGAGEDGVPGGGEGPQQRPDVLVIGKVVGKLGDGLVTVLVYRQEGLVPLYLLDVLHDSLELPVVTLYGLAHLPHLRADAELTALYFGIQPVNVLLHLRHHLPHLLLCLRLERLSVHLCLLQLSP